MKLLFLQSRLFPSGFVCYIPTGPVRSFVLERSERIRLLGLVKPQAKCGLCFELLIPVGLAFDRCSHSLSLSLSLISIFID